MKRIINILAISVLLVACATSKDANKQNSSSNSNEIVFVSVNDMHSRIEMMPKLAYLVDSLRVMYPDLILVSAGDNRTGNVYNDKSPYGQNVPMINLMNDLRFDICELGNHEFDGSIRGLKYFVDNTNFPVVCANGDFSDYPELNGKIKPYVNLDKNGVKVTVLGMIETSNFGYPSAHRDSIKDVHFTDAKEKIKEYLPLRRDCNVFVLLDHCGVEFDTVFARIFPEFNLIIGGHSHDLMTKTFDSGVLYTQSKKQLKFATVTKIQVQDGMVTNINSQPVDLNKIKKVNKKIQKKVNKYCNVPEFNEVIGHSKHPFSSRNELGAFMADAQRYVAKTDFAIQNPGGVRFDKTESTDLRIIDILNLDPFNNSLVTGTMTGKQVEEFINAASTNDYAPVHVSGLTYTIEHYIDKNDNIDHFVNAKVYLENGKRIDLNETYTVTINSYMAIWAREMGIHTSEIGQSANDAEFKYLEDLKTVDYQGVSRYNSKSIEKPNLK